MLASKGGPTDKNSVYRRKIPTWLVLLGGPCGAGVRARAFQVVGCEFSPCVEVWVFLPGAQIKPISSHLVATG